MHRLSNMPQDGIPPAILRDKAIDAQEHPSYGNWADGIVRQYRHGLAVFVFWHNRPEQANMEGQLCNVWDCLHPLEQLHGNGPSSAHLLHGFYALAS